MANSFKLENGVLVELTNDEQSALNTAQSSNAASIAASQLKSQALALLVMSDMVATRCFKAGVSFPSEWQSFVTSLRAIVSTGTGTIPATPALPVN